MSQRFFVKPGSELGHGCCFKATVCDAVDGDDEGFCEVICECTSNENAELVCAALNAFGKPS